MSQFQRVNDGVAQFTDTDLQGATVANQCGDTHGDHVIGGSERKIRWREEWICFALLDDEVKNVASHGRIAEHKGKLGMYNPDQCKRLIGDSPCFYVWQ